MKITPLLILTLLLLVSCGSSKKTAGIEKPTLHVPAPATPEVPEGPVLDNKTHEETVVAKEISPLVKEVISTAMSYHGTRYRYGGTSKKGMDCSGLIYTSFESVEVPVERTSSAMATQGDKIPLEDVRKGDLLFFTTGRNRSRINHVGLVVEVKDGVIRFIHSTTSRGVLVSSLREGYWNHAFHHARRII